MTERVPPHEQLAVLGEEIKQIVDMLVEQGGPLLDNAPEVSAKALDQATHIVALLRAVLADRWYPADGVHMPGHQPKHALKTPRGTAGGDPADQPGADGTARVQRIEVRKAGAQTGESPR